MSDRHTQLLIIGAGPGGYTAAFLAADQGREVTLVDMKKDLGGVCLSRGCIPSKTLLNVAKIISQSQEAKGLGIEFARPQIDLEKIRQRKNAVIHKLSAGLALLCKQRQISFIQGKASFQDSRTVSVQGQDGQQCLSFDNCVLATGSYPLAFPQAPNSSCIMNSTSALEIENVPPRLLVIGGGYIGLELGTVYCEFGSKVNVAEIAPRLLYGCDQDLVAILEKRLRKRFESIRLEIEITQIKKSEKNILVTFKEKNGKTLTEEFDKILVTVGRAPKAQDLGLEKTQVELNERGFVKVNEIQQTTDPNIYAVGDVAGGPLLAHKASLEGRIVAECLRGQKTRLKTKVIPAVIYTNPEIAWCGLTEEQAAKENRKVQVSQFSWTASGRAMTLNRTDGLTKLILDPETKRVLGAGIVGVEAGELISECVLAIEKGATAADIKSCSHPHPTLSETIKEAAEASLGDSPHVLRPGKNKPLAT
ncbi:MAG: dihydrolipoyl dehydrogenase [Candidatus Omnitrophota bacterium]